jgi:hypothetical protein
MPITYRVEAGWDRAIIGPSSNSECIAERKPQSPGFETEFLMRRGKVRAMITARKVAFGAVALGAVTLGAGAVAHGTSVPISYALQNRSVSAGAVVSGAPRGGTGTVANTIQQNQSQQARGLGDFLGSASATASLGAESANSSASAMQNSALGGTGFADSGFVQSSSILGTGISDSGSSASVFEVTFKVSQAEGYTFTANLSGEGSAIGHISLRNGEGADVFTPIATDNLDGFKVQGVLGAGTYSMIVDANAMTIGDESGKVNFSAALADGAVASPSVAPQSQAVPAPPAWMSSAVMLGVMGMVAVGRKRLVRVR